MDEDGATIPLADGRGEMVVLFDDEIQQPPEAPAWCEDAGTLAAKEIEAYQKAAKPWTVTVVLTGSDVMQGLNQQFRNKDKTTNVLSFPNIDAGLEEQWYVGDIILDMETVAAEAAAEGKPLANHFRHLLLHGLLHLVGYDHMRDEEASTMQTLETNLLAMLNIPDPYQEG